jgi:hypothetical protein
MLVLKSKDQTFNLEDLIMNKLLTGITLTLMTSLLIGSTMAGFVDEITVWNEPDWTGQSDVYGCLFCSNDFSLVDFLKPQQPADEPVDTPVEFDKPAPAVIPDPLPYTKGDLTNLLDKLSTRTLPSQNFSKHVFYF